MNKEQMIELLNNDLKNEWKHLRFYLHHASNIVGLHSEEYKQVLLKEANGEMSHVTEFSDLIIGLGGSATYDSNEFPSLKTPEEIITYAMNMEEEVVSNYVQRIKDANELKEVPEESVNSQWIKIFLENQIQKSREDADRYRQILRGLTKKCC
jgi:bacterioferritin (cytochrome b1)